VKRICIAGAGVIGSLLAGHLARVADVSVLARREEHARALNERGLRVSGRSDFTAEVTAATDAGALPDADLVIVVGTLMAAVLVLRPSGLSGGREFSLPRHRRPQPPAPSAPEAA